MGSSEPGNTESLLRRWHGGDLNALAELVQRNADWVLQQVRRRLGKHLRQQADSQDIVQNAMLDVLRNGPRFVIGNEQQFRALLARIVENVICDEHERQHAKKRDAERQRQLPSDTVLELDRPQQSVTRPSELAQRNEREVWVRLAMELLAPDDRKVIWLRHWLELPFEEVGERLGIDADAARMRYKRALPKLAEKLESLQRGRMDQALAAADQEAP